VICWLVGDIQGWDLGRQILLHCVIDPHQIAPPRTHEIEQFVTEIDINFTHNFWSIIKGLFIELCMGNDNILHPPFVIGVKCPFCRKSQWQMAYESDNV
jgi:hypothetical protein